MAIILPNPTRRAWQRGFWLTMAVGLGTVTGVLLWPLSPLQRLGAGALTMIIAAVPGLLRPRLVRLPFLAWNRLARLFTRAAIGWFTTICFYVVLPALGRTSSLRLGSDARGASLWTPWQHAAADGSEAAEGIVRADASARGWARDFTVWARRSRNPWAWFLLPFLAVIAAFEPPPDVEAPPPGIYTLY